MLPFSYPVPVGSNPVIWRQKVAEIADQIMQFFQDNLPSNYVATTDGPEYRDHWRVAAIALATIQVQALEVSADQTAETRGEFIGQLLGRLLLPNGLPNLDSDQGMRDFLLGLTPYLLQGATASAIEQAVQILSSGATVLEADAFTFDVLLEGNNTFGGVNPVTLEQNVRLVLEALRPAHTVYQLRHLFRESVPAIVDTVSRPDSTLTVGLASNYYEDLRSFWVGVQSIGSTANVSGRWLNDSMNDLSDVLPGAQVEVLSGDSAGVYPVVSSYRFKQDDSTPRAFTSDFGTSGFCTVQGDWLTSDTDLVHAVWGGVLTITTGPNAGNYRLESLAAGPLDESMVSSPATYLTRPTVGWLELGQPVPVTAQGVPYRVTIDRSGRMVALSQTEDVSAQFAV